MILLVGANGNMGKRYQAVLSYLGQEVVGVDVEHNRHYVADAAKRADGILIATPTATHLDLIRQFATYQKPILCEKPLTTDVNALRKLVADVDFEDSPLTMVYQYSILADRYARGWSYYNYFKHGADGLAWDCLQIIGLAQGELEIDETSPVWRCTLNGRKLDLSKMDMAYVRYVQQWMNQPTLQDLSEVVEAHEKTAEMERKLASANA